MKVRHLKTLGRRVDLGYNDELIHGFNDRPINNSTLLKHSTAGAVKLCSTCYMTCCQVHPVFTCSVSSYWSPGYAKTSPEICETNPHPAKQLLRQVHRPMTNVAIIHGGGAVGFLRWLLRLELTCVRVSGLTAGPSLPCRPAVVSKAFWLRVKNQPTAVPPGLTIAVAVAKSGPRTKHSGEPCPAR